MIEQRSDRAVRRVLYATVAAAVVLWVLPIGSSLWVDETGTYWVVKDGFAAAVRRASQIQGQSPLFYLVELLAVKLGGAHEIAMRVPSLLAMLGALFYVARLGDYLFGRTAGLIAAAGFASYETIQFAAVDARPYGLALLACAAATFYLVRWLDGAERKDAVLYAVFAIAIVYSHYVFATALVAHAVYVVARRRALVPSVRSIAIVAACVGAACAPLAPQLASLSRRSGSLSWTADPATFPALAAVIAQPVVLIAAGVALARLRRDRAPAASDRAPSSRDRESGAIALAAAWAIVPPLVNFALSRWTPAKVFHPRYFMVAVPGLFLLVGRLGSRVRPAFIGAVIAVALLASAAVPPPLEHHDEDWRGAVRAASAFVRSPSEVVLARVNLIETNSTARLEDRSAFEHAPFSFYRLDADVHVLPYTMDANGRAYTEALVRRVAGARVVVVLEGASPAYVAALRGVLSDAGLRPNGVERPGAVLVAVFDRR